MVVSPLLYTCYQNSQSISRAYEQCGASSIQPISEEMQLLLTVYYLVQLGEYPFPGSWDCTWEWKWGRQGCFSLALTPNQVPPRFRDSIPVAQHTLGVLLDRTLFSKDALAALIRGRHTVVPAMVGYGLDSEQKRYKVDSKKR